MVERNVGQMSLADGLVQASRGGILDEVEAVVDWVPLRALLVKRGGAGAGNSSYPSEVLLRCLLVGIWHGLSDPALEAAISDRLSFRRCAGLSLHDHTPDHTTLWRFRQELAQDGLIDQVFAEINRQLEARKLVLKQGTLIDASLVTARAKPPRKARGQAEDAVDRLSADPDARWGRKGKKSVFGYKIHTGVDAAHTIIRRVDLTNASLTDTEPADGLICGDEKAVYGDQAYYTHARHARLTEAGIKDRLMRRPNKHHPELPPRQKQRNKLIAKVRAPVERPYAVFKE
jgi:IS5 family transposase